MTEENLEDIEAAEEATPEPEVKAEPKKEVKPELDLKTRLYIAELETKVSEYEGKMSDIREYVKKMEGEIQQIRLRSQRDLQKSIDKTTSDFFQEILPIVDNFERSLKSAEKNSDPFTDGIRLIHQQLAAILQKTGLTRIETKDQSFDPAIHEAIATVPVEILEQDGRIFEEVKAGYKYKELIVRPAQVLVGRKAEVSGAENS